MTIQKQIEDLENEISAQKQKLAELKRSLPPLELEDFEFQGANGPVKLSELFGDSSDLVVINNMGRGCAYCTLWADGLNGCVPELRSRAGFALVSADPIEVLAPFAAERGWRFDCVSGHGVGFAKALDLVEEEGGVWPAVIGLYKDAEGKIWRIRQSSLGEGDDYAPIWHLLALLKDGWAGWEPDYRL
ncbi:MAG: DUF899 family protein [Fimbriimonas sp.]